MVCLCFYFLHFVLLTNCLINSILSTNHSAAARIFLEGVRFPLNGHFGGGTDPNFWILEGVPAPFFPKFA